MCSSLTVEMMVFASSPPLSQETVGNQSKALPQGGDGHLVPVTQTVTKSGKSTRRLLCQQQTF